MKQPLRTFVLILLNLQLVALLTSLSSAAFSADDTCEGFNTLLYTNDKVTLTICHGTNTKIDRKQLDKWQDCIDASIQIRDKTKGVTNQYADCSPDIGKQIRLYGNTFMLRHFQTTYPAFDAEPLLIETLNLDTNKKTYTFEKQFQACTRNDIDYWKNHIDSAVDKPFNGNTYFTSVYRGFYKLRDCAKSDPYLVLSILNNYQNSGHFDGEVAEVLSSVTSDVELIYEASIH